MFEESIRNLLLKTLYEVKELVNNNNSKSRIILPLYRATIDNERTIRYSEQELKQVFLSNLEKGTDFYYSVETPSECVYSISNSKKPEIKKIKDKDDHCVSARIDVSLYDSKSPKDLLCHIEFKHDNPDEKEIDKDFLRLTNEMGKNQNNYFVHYVVRESDQWKSKTYPSILDKYKEALLNPKNSEENLQNVWVYLMFIKIGKKPETRIMIFNLQSLKDNHKDKEKFNEKKLKSWMEII